MTVDGRTLYSRVVDPECRLVDDSAAVELRSALRRVDRSVESLDGRRRGIREWASAETTRFRELVGAEEDGYCRHLMVREVASSCAPLAILLGAWLSGLSSPDNADDPLTLRLLAVYAADVGVGKPYASRGSEYRNLLRKLGLSELAGPAARLALHGRVPTEAFTFPASLMAMSRRPEDFGPELLGADLCLRTMGLLPALAAARDELPELVDWAALDPAPTAGEVHRVAAASAAERVGFGFDWAGDAVRRWSEQLRRRLHTVREPSHLMAELLRRRAREGSVYHQSFRLAGRPLAEWLRMAQEDPHPLMEVLRESRLLRPGDADRSPLVNGMLGPRGPMFRIFSADDVLVIRRWIDSLGDRASDAPTRVETPPPASIVAAVPGEPVTSGRARFDVREAYRLLQPRALNSAVHAFAVHYVRQWLAGARHGVKRGGVPLPATWPGGGLRPWLLEQHDRHAQQFEAADAAPQGRDELVDSSVQLAPLTLIDGAWLRGFTDYELAATDVGYRLFDTYWDELGNGEPDLNHPRIYRELLASMGVALPPTGSEEFATWPGFRDESFALPVYWLSIGHFPRTFMPEILGLNLAMELSGVGGSYRQAHRALRAHGFSTRFVDIHNTIDNVATGHSAWAADAIDSFMAGGQVPPDGRARAETWGRIRVGFRSLTPPTTTWARWVRRLAGTH